MVQLAGWAAIFVAAEISVHAGGIVAGEVPSLFAVALAIRAMKLPLRELGLRPARGRDVVALVLAGLALGYPGYLILEPDPLVTATPPAVLGAVLFSLFAFAAVLEEVLLRGVLQRAASRVSPAGGVVVSTAATALLYAGSVNVRYVVFATLVAVLFGLEVRRTGTIVGVIAGHTAWLWVELIVLPTIRG